MVGEVNSFFDIAVIYNNITIKGEISKIRFNNKEKSSKGEITCKTFFNQISIYMTSGLCVKLFSNGKFQISGSKTELQAETTIRELLKNIKTIYGEVKVNYDIFDGFPIYDGKVLVKSGNNYIARCNYSKKEFHVFDSVFLKCELTGLLIEKFHTDRSKRILDVSLNHVGNARYNMFRKGKNLCLKHMSYRKINDDEYEIFNEKYNVPYGVLVFEWLSEPNTGLPDTPEVILSYSALEYNSTISNLRVANMNSSIKLEIGSKSIDRISVHDKLATISSIEKLEYNPAKFPGIKFIHDGVKVTIFRTGSIILASTESPDKTVKFINDLFEEDDFTVDKTSLEVDTSRVLTIWDLFD